MQEPQSHCIILEGKVTLQSITMEVAVGNIQVENVEGEIPKAAEGEIRFCHS
jgi:hypothetical protein